MNLYLIMKLLHVLAAFWFISGVIGRDFAFSQGAKRRTFMRFMRCCR
jgi:hypothetical protein